MNKFMITAAFVLAFSGLASAQEAPASPDWTTVQRACGTEYREANKATRPTWQEFLSECKVRKGFVPKRAGKAEVRLPDVAPKN